MCIRDRSGNITLTAADVGAALPNLLVNPDFAINQRGKESYTASSTQYTLSLIHI